MARTVDPAVYAVRRDAFVEVATRLIQTKGFEQMSIQDLLDALDVSRGAFYHYFGSKEDLLDAVVERMVDTGLALVEPILTDPDLPAPEKLRRVFSGIGAWKADQRDLVLAVLDIWMSPHNAIVRERLRRRQGLALHQILQQLVDQGVRDGAFRTGEPAYVASVLTTLFQGAGDEAARLFLARRAEAVPVTHVQRTFEAYRTAVERILDATPGSIVFMDDEALHLWFD